MVDVILNEQIACCIDKENMVDVVLNKQIACCIDK
jgi:hypothetical protein